MNRKQAAYISLRLWGAGLLILLLVIVVAFSWYCPGEEVLCIAGIVSAGSLPALLMLLVGVAFIRELSYRAETKSLLTVGLMFLIILLYWLSILLFFLGFPALMRGVRDSVIYFFLPLVAAASGSFLINRSFLLSCYQSPVESSNQTNQ